MAITANWGFTNNTDSTHVVTPKVMDTASSFAVVTDDPGKCVLKNTTCPIDQVEVLTYMASDIATVNQTDKNLYPPRVQDGRAVTVKLEDKLRLSSSVDDTFIVDLPGSVNVTWRFTKSKYMTAEHLLLLFQRLAGAIQDDLNSGSSRLGDLMMMQLNPNA